MPSQPVQYVAQIANVHEVSILGTADLAFWRERLKHENLTLAERDHQAQILVMAADMKFFGLRFQEVSFSLLIDGAEGTPRIGAYLLQAYNSRRFFAWVERNIFKTPYYYAEARVTCDPASVTLTQAGEVVFRAEMSSNGSAQATGASPSQTLQRTPARQVPVREGEDGWDGPVLLPNMSNPTSNHGTGGRGKTPGEKLFFARVHGHTRFYPFLPGEDALQLKSRDCDNKNSSSKNGSNSNDIIQALIDSGFACIEWSVRDNATHQKSKTYPRSTALT